MNAGAHPAVASGDVEDSYPLAPVQRAMLYQSLSAPNSGVYIQHAVCDLRERIDGALLRQAWRAVIARHPALRTAFRLPSRGEPVQDVHRDVAIDWADEDWTALAPEAQHRRFDAGVEADARRDFDLERAPPLRFALFRLADEHARLLWTWHHAVQDGRSARLVLREAFDVYDALVAKRPPELPPPPAPYRDHVAWLARQDAEAARRYWCDALAGVAPISLAARLPRADADAPTGDYAMHELRFTRQATDALTSIAREHGVTLNTLVVGAWAQLLARYSDESDVSFLTTLTLRGAGPADFRDMIGPLLNTVPMRVRVPRETKLSTWLAGLRAQWLAMRAHAWAPLTDILHWAGLAHEPTPLSSLVVFEHQAPGAALAEDRPGWTTRQVSRRSWPGHALTLVAFGAPELSLKLAYDRSRFGGAAVAAMLTHLRTLLEGTAEGLDRPLLDQPLLPADERRRLLIEWNDTARTFGGEPCIHRRIEQQAARTPDAVAIASEHGHLAYRELNERANALARELHRGGIERGTLVGICANRTPELVVAILAVMKAGGAWLAIDPGNPAPRIAFIIRDAALATVIATKVAAPALGDFAGRLIVADERPRSAGEAEAENPMVPVGPDDLAYAVYTSGSTGEPNGILVTHRALANHTLALVERYDIGPTDRRLQFVSIGSDVLIAEVFPVLVAGGTLVLRPDAGILSIADFLQLLDDRKVTIAGLPSAYWHEWVAAMAGGAAQFPASLRLVVSGMDRVRVDLFAIWARVARGRVRWFNAYGPSETTCTAASFEADLTGDPAPAVVPIGRPLPNVRIYILDAHGRPVPVGLPGEIHIGGHGVARSYLNRPDLTAARFLTDPFSAQPQDRLYRTGDLGRYLPDGNIEFLGRIDDQIKIRGHRVEPREIEDALLRLPGIRDACVTARGDRAEARRLVAYVVVAPGDAPAPAGLRAGLRRTLPDHMVPAAFVALEALPLLPSGKVDVRALPDPGPAHLDPQRAPAASDDALQSALTAVWEASLSARVGVHDNYFELGGDSLSGMRLLAEVAARFGVRIPVAALFDDAGTIAGMAARIHAERDATVSVGPSPTIPRRAGDAPVPLSSTQAGAWFLHRLDPTGIAYNEPRLWAIEGEVDVDTLRAALATVAARQPMLRTRFVVVDGHPRQLIDPAPAVDLEVVDLASAPGTEDARLAAAVRERTHRRFDLAAAPPSRWTLLRQGPARYALLRVAHHIVGDALSARILHRELSRAYAALLAGQAPPLPPLAIDYADFSVWQAAAEGGARVEPDLAFWKARLVGLPVLRLPADFVRPAAQSFRGATVAATIPREAATALKALGRGDGATAFAVWLAAFSVLLSRLSGDIDLAIGTPVAARGLPELAPIVGFFANTVVFRADLSGAPTTHALLARTRDALADILAHQEAPLERVVEALGVARDPSRNPLFQVAFAFWDHDGDDLTLAGTRCRRVDSGMERAKFDLTVSVIEGAERVDVRWEYCTDLFRRATVERMSRQFARLVAGMAATPELPVTALPLMDDATAERVLRQAVGVASAYPDDATIPERFAEQVRARPAAPAVGALDYAGLDAAANRMARELRRRGVGPGTVVAVARQATSDIAVAWLAVLKAGAAYMPIDAGLPAERIGRMIADARVGHAVADDALATALSRPGISVLCPDRDARAIADQAAEAPHSGAGPGDPAYVMYTSGSTGVPKGVVIPHRAVLRLVCGTDCAQIVPADTVAQLSNPAFDASTFEFWGALLNGARIAGIPKTTAIAPRALAQALASEGVTALFLTTALFNAVAREAPDAFRTCRCVLFGGEAVEPRWVAAVARAGPPRHLLHVYGPTETTTFATWHEVRDVAPNAATIPIGRPLANTEAFVLRDDGEPAAPGELGELWIGGPGLASGYCNAAPEAAARFVERRVGHLPARRLYRTGDLARVDEDGAIEFLGRRDRQVKLRGHRIELEEIEAAIARLPQVRAAAVAVQGETSDTRQIVAWVVAADPAGPPPAELRRDLRRVLPDYMLPASIVWVKTLPLNASGKVDRHALPAVTSIASAAPGSRVAPRDMLEQVLCGIWERVLGTSGIGALDHFFEIGGHSLLAAELFDEIERETGVAVPLAALFADDTIAGLARALRDSPAELAAPIVAVNDDGKRPPLVFLHGDLSGGGFYCRALARALGPEQPVLVVAPHGLDNAPIPETIEAMAADRIRALRAMRPQGPYLLGGYCNGAYVAFEMARQLVAAGEAAPLVVVIEAVAPRGGPAGAATSGERYVTIDRAGVHALSAHDRASEAQLRYSRAMERYAGGPYAQRFVLLRTGEGSDPRRDLGWARLVRRLELLVLPGNHVTLVTRHIDTLAQAIRGAIERTLESATTQEPINER